MKRDIELIRRICFAVEAMPPGEYLSELDEVEAHVFAEHIELMQDAGLVQAQVAHSVGGPPHAWVERLTWAGHDFVEAARDDNLWEKAKANVMRPGASWTFDVLKEWLKAEIAQGLPTLRGLAQ